MHAHRLCSWHSVLPVQFATSAAKLSSIGHKSNHTKPFSFLSLIKTRAKGVVESMGNYVELHADKRRGMMDISDIGVEAMIHWIGPPLAWADKLGEASLDRVFGGKGR